MQYGKTLKILICLLLIIPILNTGQASANTNYDHDTLMQYEGYGKAMYETIVEQTTFVSGQFTDNKQYVKDSWQSIKDYADWAYNNLTEVTGKCGISNTARECLGEVLTTGGAAFLTVGDWVKKIFNGYESEYNSGDLVNDFYNNYLIYNQSGDLFTVKPNYQLNVELPGRPLYIWTNGMGPFDLDFQNVTENSTTFSSQFKVANFTSEYLTFTDVEKQFLTDNRYTNNFSTLVTIANMYGFNLYFTDLESGQILLPRPLNEDITRFVDYIDDNNFNLPVPTLKPQLVCPDGTKINMIVNGSTFLSQSGQVMQVNTDGTAQVLEQTCNLNWQKPTIDYVDDKAAITDPDGNWLDLLTGEMLECMLTGDCKPSLPKEDEEVDPLDDSLLVYVKNAYDYATGVLKTATDGLKSLATGAKDLTGLFGTFFSWLPGEMVVLMSSGLGIVIGLRLFRK